MGLVLLIGLIGSLFCLIYGMQNDAYPLMIVTGIFGLVICAIYAGGVIQTSGVSGLIALI